MFSYDDGVYSLFAKENVMSISLSSSPSSHFTGSFSRALTPQMDRRAYADRRTLLKPMPVVVRSWAQYAVIGVCLGVLIGSTAAFAVLAQRQTSGNESAASAVNLELAVPAAAIMAPLFDTAPFVASVPSASTRLTRADSAANPGGESYSEDAAGVPGATYQEPATRPTATTVTQGLSASRTP